MLWKSSNAYAMQIRYKMQVPPRFLVKELHENEHNIEIVKAFETLTFLTFLED